MTSLLAPNTSTPSEQSLRRPASLITLTLRNGDVIPAIGMFEHSDC
jgi:hypothetical protein